MIEGFCPFSPIDPKTKKRYVCGEYCKLYNSELKMCVFEVILKVLLEKK